MMIQALFFLFVLTVGSSTNPDLHDPEDDQFTSNWTSDFLPKTQVEDPSFECSWESILKKLDLRENNDKYTAGRPVKDHRHLTRVNINMKIFGILDVREADQMFVSYIWVKMRWNNEHIRWNPDQFCGQKHVLVPTKYLWMPDLTIEEMTERDKTAPSPNLNIRHDGWVEYRNGQVVESTCTMDVFRFPFDTQACQISFKSITYSDEELMLFYNRNKTGVERNIRKTIQTQSEWNFCGFSAHKETVDYFGFNQTVIVFTITLKRRSDCYVANFLLPIFFFLCLDFASFLMLDTGGEKVGFKITVILSVTLMQLMLNDILPPSSGSVPLIGRYCVGIFSMMMLSLLETILVIYLKNKDLISLYKKDEDEKLNENPEDKHSPLPCCCTGIKKQMYYSSAEDAAKEDQYFPKEGSSSPYTDVSLVMEKVYEEMGEMRKLITLISSRTMYENQSG